MGMIGNDDEKKELTPLEQKKRRLRLYYDREEHMLSVDGIQSYGIGSRNVTRYNTDLANIRAQIKELEKEIKEMVSNKKPRKAVAVVPQDW